MTHKAKKQSGLLTPITIELPPENAEEAARLAKQNEEIKHLGFRTFRGGTDYGFVSFNSLNADPQKERKPTRLQSGTLVKIFNSVTDGDIQWQGKIDFDRKEYHHGLQRGIERSAWARMFFNGLPAKLVQNGKTIFGHLEPFCETGTEGVIWSVKAYGIPSYDGLFPLENGNDLTIYSRVRNGNIAWQGTLDFGPEKITKLGWTEIVRTANHMDTEKWLHMCYDRLPLIIEKQPKPQAPKP